MIVKPSKSFVAAASLAVIASFAGAPAAAAAGQHNPQLSRHGQASQSAHRSVPRTGLFAVIAKRPQHFSPNLVRPARPAKPAAVPNVHVKLWHATPSYTLRPNVRAISAAIPGITGHCQIAGGVHSGTWSATSCPDGYEVSGDVTVPVGKTLTVKANTVVYFDPILDGTLTPLHPSELTDLIVDGTLTIAGSTADPVLFTSANAAPGSAVLPQAGDWGYVFFNHTGAAKGAGSITHLRLLYGEGIAADRVAPAITSSTISDVAAGETSALIASSIVAGAGIDYEDIPGGTVTLSHDVFDGAQVAGIELDSKYTHLDFSGAASAGHPFTLDLVDSHITGGGTSGLEDTVLAESYVNGASTSSNHSAVTLDVHGNHMTQTADGETFDVQADANPTAVVGTAAITGVFSHNVIDGGAVSSGTYFSSYVGDSSTTGTASCNGAAACIVVPYMSDRVSADEDGVYNESEVNSGPGRSLVDTPVGKVVKKKIKKKHHKTVTKLVNTGGGTYESQDSQAWQSYSDNETAGDAALSLPVVASTFESDSQCIDAEADAARGSSTNSVHVRDSTMISTDDDDINIQAYGSIGGAPTGKSTGSASSTVGLTGGHYTADDQIIDNDNGTRSGYGSASSHITIDDAILTSADDTSVESNSSASQNGGSGGATSDIAMTNSTLRAEEGGIENSASAVHGTAPATAKVTAKGSTISAFEADAVDNDATAAEDTGSHGAALLTTTFDASKVQSLEYAMNLESQSSYGGSATSSPTITSSSVDSTEDYAIQNRVLAAADGGSGAATGSPTITGSTVDAGEYVINNNVQSSGGSGTATGSPVITDSTVSSLDDYDIDNDVIGTDESGSSGGAVGSPKISGGSAVAEGYVIFNSVTADYGGAIGSPALSHTTAVSGEDYAILNDVAGSESGGHGRAVASPSISHSIVHADEYGLSNQATSDGGAATGDPVISHSTVVASENYALYNVVTADEDRNTGDTATGSPRIMDSTAHAVQGGLYNQASGDQGPAVGNPEVTGSTLTVTGGNGVDNQIYGGVSSAGTGTGDPVISASKIIASEEGVYNQVDGDHGGASAKPTVSHTTVSALFESALFNEAQAGLDTSTGSASALPKVTSTALYCADCTSGYGLYNQATSTEGGATASPTVSGSTVHNPGSYGVYNEAFAAESAGHGTATAKPSITSSPISADNSGLFNEATASNGNSAADASFSVTGDRITSLADEPIDVSAHSHGTAASTVNPAISGVVLRAPDDDPIDIAVEPLGNGAALVGGHISSSTIVGEGDGFDLSLSPGAAGASATFDTSFSHDSVTALEDRGMEVSGTVDGGPVTLAPTITGGSITASDDDAIQLQASGYGAAASDELKVAPKIDGTPMVSENGVSLSAHDSSGAAEPGHVVVAGSITDSSIVATDDYGLEANADCTYCAGGARTDVTVSNTAITGANGAGYFTATTASTTSAPASVAGSATSTHHDTWTAKDGLAVDVNANSAAGTASDSFSVSGLQLSGEQGQISAGVTSSNGNANNTASYTGNTLVNDNGSSDQDDIDDETNAAGAGHVATRTGSISHNSISDEPGDGAGIYVYIDGIQDAPELTIEHNSVTNVGSVGIDVESYWSIPPATSDGVTIEHNSISRTGHEGIYLFGIRPTVTSNTITMTGLAGGLSPYQDGLAEDGSPFQGSVTCNVISGNTVGVAYGTENPTTGSAGHNGDPKTNDNSFRALTTSVRNSTDLMTGNLGTGRTDAQNNFWGGSPRLASPTNRYDTTPRLTKAPACTKTAGN